MYVFKLPVRPSNIVFKVVIFALGIHVHIVLRIFKASLNGVFKGLLWICDVQVFKARVFWQLHPSFPCAG